MRKNDHVSKIISLIFTVRQLVHEKAAKGGLRSSPLHCITLKYIHEKKPLMKDIAGYLLVTPPSATSLVNNFMKSGMVARESDKNDRRIVRIVLTEKGKKHLKKNFEVITERIRCGLESLNEKEQDQMVKILSKIINHQK